MCSEFGCATDCTKEAHINCTCSKDKKIPVKELAFIKGQRNNIGSIGPHQIGLPDFPEHNRLIKKQKRGEVERTRLADAEQKKECLQTSSLPSHEESSSGVGNEKESDTEDGSESNYDLAAPSTSNGEKQYNTLDIPNVAMQSIRYGVGLRATAAITTAAFIDIGLITEENTKLVVDHNKVKRAQEKLMSSLDNEFEEIQIHCLMNLKFKFIVRWLTTANRLCRL